MKGATFTSALVLSRRYQQSGTQIVVDRRRGRERRPCLTVSIGVEQSRRVQAHTRLFLRRRDPTQPRQRQRPATLPARRRESAREQGDGFHAIADTRVFSLPELNFIMSLSHSMETALKRYPEDGFSNSNGVSRLLTGGRALIARVEYDLGS